MAIAATDPDHVDNPSGNRPLLTPATTAARLGITLRALADLRRRGFGPRYVRLSPTTIRYFSDDIRADAAEQLCRD